MDSETRIEQYEDVLKKARSFSAQYSEMGGKVETTANPPVSASDS